MKRSHQIVLWVMMGITIILSAIILFFVVFRQSAIPDLQIGPAGKDAKVDYDKVEKIIEDRVDKEVAEIISNLPLPQNGKDAEPVNYPLIYSYVDGKFSTIPLPRDGATGATGSKGSSCSTTQLENGAAITCEDGTSAIITNGTNGANGADGRTPELRCNDNKNRWEVKYNGDPSWTVLRNSSNNSPVKCVNLL